MSTVVVIAASTPSDCFETAFEAARIAVEHMLPVMLLSDGYIANGSEPWVIPEVTKLPKIKNNLVTSKKDEFLPYKRDDKTFSKKLGNSRSRRYGASNRGFGKRRLIWKCQL